MKPDTAATGLFERKMRIHDVARALGVLLAGFWLLFVGLPLGGSALGRGDPWTWEHSVMALYVLALLAVLVLGWRRPVRGSAIAMLAAAGMTLFVVLTKSGRDMIVPLLITVAPTLIVSGTFLLAGRKESTGDDRKP